MSNDSQINSKYAQFLGNDNSVIFQISLIFLNFAMPPIVWDEELWSEWRKLSYGYRRYEGEPRDTGLLKQKSIFKEKF